MSFALARKEVHCPNCSFDSKSKIKGTGGGLGFAGFALVIVSFFAMWPLGLLGMIMMLVAIFRPATHICPSCGWEYPIPADEWAARQRTKS
jgi:rubredoxin